MELIFERDRYQLVCTGWSQKCRIYGSLIHIDLKGDKICIQIAKGQASGQELNPISISAKITANL